MPADPTDRRPSFLDRHADSIAWVCLLTAMGSIDVSLVQLEKGAAAALTWGGGAIVSAPAAVPSTAKGIEIEMASEIEETVRLDRTATAREVIDLLPASGLRSLLTHGAKPDWSAVAVEPGTTVHIPFDLRLEDGSTMRWNITIHTAQPEPPREVAGAAEPKEHAL